MAVAVSYPGVYVEEVGSGVRTIAGVATSICAFVGYTRKGVPEKPVKINGVGQFEREYGGLDAQSPLSYAVHQFFANGGTNAIIVRVAKNTSSAKWVLSDATAPVLDITATSPGGWAKDVTLAVSHDARNPDADFNLVVSELQGTTRQVVETHRNLSLDPNSPQFVGSIDSTRISVAPVAGLTFNSAGAAVGKAMAGAITVNDDLEIAGAVDGDAFKLTLANKPTTIATAVAEINAAITQEALSGRLVASESKPDGTAGNGAVKLASKDTTAHSSVVVFGGGSGGVASVLGLGQANGGREFTGAAQHRPKEVDEVGPSANGVDGIPGGATELVGATAKSGMKALLDVDLFNLLCIPETFGMDDGDATTVAEAAVQLCEKKRAFYIADAPKDTTLDDIVAWAGSFRNSSYAAVYFPAVRVADPLDRMRLRSMAPSGSVAGVFARTDGTRGVWKAPAGIDATLAGVRELDATISDLDNGDINPKGVNALRSFPVYGRVVWGARTRKGDDSLADEYKYVPVRRLALFLEESLYRGTQWVVFEPNDEPLWAQIRLNVGAFMHNLFRQGAFQGATPKDAYFVRCDRETTTQSDINLGIVNIHVGFAPLKPAEFVVLKIQQIPGDIPT